MGYEVFLNAQNQASQRARQRQSDALDSQKRNALTTAGTAYAGGDVSGARNALYGAGMLDEGMAIDRAQAQRTAQAEEQRQASVERQQAALSAGAMGLRRLPQEQRWEVYRSRVLPRLQAEGLGQDILAQITPEVLDDANLDSVILMSGGELPQARYIQGARGALDTVDPYSGALTTVRQPQQQDAPNGYRWTADGALEPIKGGPADPAQASRLATSRRAPKTGSSGRGSGARSSAPAAAGRPWERSW